MYKKMKKYIPDAYNRERERERERLSLVNIEEISKNKSESEKPKFENVIGNSNNAEANIAGITPAVFILRGKCDDSPP